MQQTFQRFFALNFVGLFLLLAVLVFFQKKLAAQETGKLKLSFLTYQSYTYKENPLVALIDHPFYGENKASSGGTLALGSQTDQERGIFFKLLHYLPSFGIEYVNDTGLPIFKGYGVGFEHLHVSLKEYELSSIRKTLNSLPRVVMDSYLYSLQGRVYFASPMQEGVNFILGLSLSVLDGDLKTYDFGNPTTYNRFSKYFVWGSLVGVEVKGKNFGIRYELNNLVAPDVEVEENPFPNQRRTIVDMTGATIKLAGFYQF